MAFVATPGAVVDQTTLMKKYLQFVAALTDSNTPDETKLKMMQEVSENFENVTTSPQYSTFLEHIIPRFLTFLQDGEVQFLQEKSAQQVRKLVLEIIHRIPTNEHLRSHTKNILSVMFRFLEVENEENVLICLRIIIELHKQFRPPITQEIHHFLDFVKQIYNDLPKVVTRYFEKPQAIADNTVPSPEMVGMITQVVVKTNPEREDSESRTHTIIPRGSLSLKVLAELPIIVVLMYQLYKQSIHNVVSDFVPLIMSTIMLQVTPQARQNKLYNKELYADFIAAQIKTLSFLAYIIRIYQDLVGKYSQQMVKGMLQLLSNCPSETAHLRKELLIAAKHILTTDLRNQFIPCMDKLFDESVLIGSGYTARETLRPLAYSTLADLVHHVRQHLPLNDLALAVQLFAKNIDDESLPSSIQTMSCKLLLNLVDCIRSKSEQENGNGRDILMRMLEVFVLKFHTISRYQLSTIFKKCKPQSELTATEAPIAAAQATPTQSVPPPAPPTPTLPVPALDKHGDKEKEEKQTFQVSDCRSLVKTLVCGVKTITWGITSCKAPGEASFIPNKQLQPKETQIYIKLVKYAMQALDIYQVQIAGNGQTYIRVANCQTVRMKEEKEVLEHFAGVFTMMNPLTFKEIFQTTVPYMVERISKNYALQIVANSFLANPSTSALFATILVEYLLDRLPEMGSNVELSNLYLKLFKLVFGSVSLFAAENEQMLKPHLHKIVNSSMELAQTAKEPYNYFLLLRALFRSIGGGSHDLLYQEFLPLLPNLLQGLNMLQSGLHKQHMKDLFVELCLTVPVRLSSLLPYLPMLMDPLVSALNGSQTLVSQGLRTLELCVDNLQPDFLYDHIQPVRAELMQALWRTLRNPADSISHVAYRVLGKFGGSNRKMLKESQKLQYVVTEVQGPSITAEFSDCKASIQLPMEKFLEGATIEVDQIHTHMRPLLMMLGDYRSLTLNVVNRLTSVTRLFPNSFNDKFCDQMMQHLRKWMEVVVLTHKGGQRSDGNVSSKIWFIVEEFDGAVSEWGAPRTAASGYPSTESVQFRGQAVDGDGGGEFLLRTPYDGQGTLHVPMEGVNDSSNTAGSPGEMLSRRCVSLLKMALRPDMWPKAELKLQWFDKLLMTVEQPNQANMANICTGLEVLSFLLTVLQSSAILSSFKPLQRGIAACMTCGNNKVLRAVHTLLSRLMSVFPTEPSTSSVASKYEELECLYAAVGKVIYEGLTNYEKAANTNPNQLFGTLMILKSACSNNPSYIDRLISVFMRSLQKMVRDHLNPQTTPGPSETNTVTVELIMLSLELVKTRLAVMSMEMRKNFIQVILTSLIEKSPDAKILRAVVKIVEEWVKNNSPMAVNQTPTLREKSILLVKMMTYIEKRFPDDLELNAQFLDLVNYVYRDENLSGSELTAKLEPAFLAGLRCCQPHIRAKFFEVFDNSMRRRVYDRLLYITCSQNWEAMGSHFWIKQCIELLLAVCEKNTTIGTNCQGAMLPSITNVINLADSHDRAAFAMVTHVKQEPRERENSESKEEDVEIDIELAPGDQSGTPKTKEQSEKDAGNQLHMLTNRHDKFLDSLREVKTGALLSAYVQLCHISTALAEKTWIQLFPRLWKILSDRQQHALAGEISPFLCSGSHQVQRDCQPSALNCFVEAMSQCVPHISIRPCVLKYLGKTHNLWFRSTLMLEHQAFEKGLSLQIKPRQTSEFYEQESITPPPQEILDSLAELYSLLQEEDMWAGLWQKRCKFPETATAIAYEQHGFFEQAQETYEKAMDKARKENERNNASPAIFPEYQLWEDHWNRCSKELNQWEALTEYGQSKGHVNPYLVLECAWRVSNWAAMKEALVQVELSCPKEMAWKVNMYRGYLAICHPEEQQLNFIERLVEMASSLAIREWRRLPHIVSHVHTPLLQAAQQIIELQEAAQINAGLQPANLGRNTSLHDMKTVVKTWRNRLPIVSDDLSHWSSIFMWRQHHYQAAELMAFQLLIQYSKKYKLNKDFDFSVPGSMKLHNLISKLKKWIKILEAKTKQLPKFFLIEEKCRFLSNFSAQTADVEIPGEFLMPKPTHYYIKIARFMPRVEIVQKHNTAARRLYIRGHNGKIYPYLVMNDACLTESRREERVLQLLRLLNPCLEKRKETTKRHLFFTVPRVVAVSPQMRLVEDNPSSLSLVEIYKQRCAKKGIEHDNPISRYYDRLATVQARGTQASHQVLRDILKEVQGNMVPRSMLKEWALHTFPNATDYWTFRKMFTIQLALIGFAEFVLHLNRLNPEMLQIAQDTGKLNVAYFRFDINDNSGDLDANRPVPFRLTPNISEFLTTIGVSGPLTASMIAVARCFAQPNFKVDGILKAVLRDEIIAWHKKTQEDTSSPLSAAGQPENMDSQQLVSLVQKAVTAIVTRLHSLAQFEGGESKVNTLVAAANSLDNLCRMDPAWHPWL
ncbi:transformation/transcription domain-associated protein [Rhincodon typus]|uniref:transformation/transcription domain-associated protein n=1 Tax=Rhincodon typus TaxID=259920 RepID=UPI00203075A0|nr:transformation/transcription domain-associated protein [Rhincodon typus]